MKGNLIEFIYYLIYFCTIRKRKYKAFLKDQSSVKSSRNCTCPNNMTNKDILNYNKE